MAKYSDMGLFGIFNKSKKETLDKGLEKTKQSVFRKLRGLLQVNLR